MTIKQKISLAAQPTTIHFFKEGMFYKLYNQDAMWFVQNVKRYKVAVVNAALAKETHK